MSLSTNLAARHFLRVGDLARMTGKTVRAIHLYEELGLLRPARRTRGGFRLYDEVAVQRVRWIDLLHGLGFSLHEMKSLHEGWWRSKLGPQAMGQLKELFQRKLEETRATAARYAELERELLAGLEYLETCGECATPTAAVAGCLHCSQDHGMEHEPALVAGIKTSPGAIRRPGGGGLIRVEDIG